MERQEAKDFLPLIEAYSKGEVIEWQNGRGEWNPQDTLCWNYSSNRYRIKPQPKLVPFTSEDNLIGKVITYHPNKNKSLIIGQTSDGIYSGNSSNIISYKHLLVGYTFEDGNRCGKYINEE